MKARRPWDEPDVDPSDLFIRVDLIDVTIRTHGYQRWRSEAACVSSDVPLEWFFGDSSLDSVLNTRRARAVCAACPVKRPCLGFALDHEAQGIWAGTTERQRHDAEWLPMSERVDHLLEEARIAASTGPWRSITPEEWRDTG